MDGSNGVSDNNVQTSHPVQELSRTTPKLAYLVMEEDEEIAARARSKLNLQSEAPERSISCYLYVIFIILACFGIAMIVYGSIAVSRRKSQ